MSVADRHYISQYFSEASRRWLGRAYGEGRYPTCYPIGLHRVRLAMESVLERLGAARGRLVDLGCGGGELLEHAARLGFDVTGIDIAPGMMAEAEARRRELPEALRDQVTLLVRDVLENGLPDASADAVTAIGVIEYLESDAEFFRETARLLRPGGVLVVSCRNRLFNLASLNRYTREEIERDHATRLLDELLSLGFETTPRECLKDLVGRLRALLPDLEEALALDLGEAQGPGVTPSATFGQPRRQHTPREVAAAAAALGFSSPRFLGVHPHPFPPAMEALAPRFYNRLASALEPLEATPWSLAWSSTFLGVFTR